MIKIGLVFIFLALNLYTIAVWKELGKKHLLNWIVFTFAGGFLCDLIGTSIMFYVAKHRFEFGIHSITGYGALVIMFLHLMWALFAKKYPKYEVYFTKFSVYAWALWLVAFFTGMFLNMNL